MGKVQFPPLSSSRQLRCREPLLCPLRDCVHWCTPVQHLCLRPKCGQLPLLIRYGCQKWCLAQLVLIGLMLTHFCSCLLLSSLAFFSWSGPWASLNKGQVPPWDTMSYLNLRFAVNIPFLLVYLFFDHSISQLPPSFPVSTLVLIQLSTSWLPFPPKVFTLANSAAGRCPGGVTQECRRLLKDGRTKGWHIAKCHCKRIPCGECGGLEWPRPQGSGVAFSVPCWLNFVRSPSWPRLSIPVELSLC